MSATNRGAKRHPGDFYPTPWNAFDPLIPYLPKHGVVIWEPACGDSRLIHWMREAGLVAGGDDIQQGYDFLKDTIKRDTIVTNPPFTLALEFCTHAINQAHQVFMLLRLNFLGSKKRKTWWQQHEPDAIFVLSERPSFTTSGTDACEYGWFYWGPQHKGIIHL